MGANRGAIDVVVPALRHRLGESDGDALPDTAGAPAPEAPIDRIPIAIFLRNIAPWRASAQPPQNSIDDVAIIFGRPSSAALAGLSLNRQQNFKIRHSTSVRSPRLKAASSNLQP